MTQKTSTLITDMLVLTARIRRCQKMTKRAMNVAKGVGAVVATTMVAGYVGNKIKQKSPRKVKKRASQAMQSMGDIVSDISYILK